MSEHPILFSGGMVRAILDGRKTQTRRVMKPQPAPDWPAYEGCNKAHEYLGRKYRDQYGAYFGYSVFRRCPYGGPKDWLWVRESWAAYRLDLPNGGKEYPNVLYRADATTRLILGTMAWMYNRPALTWRPAIYMPRAFSRITLRVVGVRCERVQDIGDDAARAEGVKDIAEFYALWEGINGGANRHGNGWMDNPWVWVVEFEKVTP